MESEVEEEEKEEEDVPEPIRAGRSVWGSVGMLMLQMGHSLERPLSKAKGGTEKNVWWETPTRSVPTAFQG